MSDEDIVPKSGPLSKLEDGCVVFFCAMPEAKTRDELKQDVNRICLLSIALSLKRLADSMEPVSAKR